MGALSVLVEKDLRGPQSELMRKRPLRIQKRCLDYSVDEEMKDQLNIKKSKNKIWFNLIYIKSELNLLGFILYPPEGVNCLTGGK